MGCVHVVAGALGDSQGRVLVARRHAHLHQGGLWEFPGGKLEPGEAPRQGLAREFWEELGIHVLDSEPLIRLTHDYGDRHILLDVWRVTRYQGEPQGREGQPLRWLYPEAMRPAEFPAADRPIITALRLPDRMLITGPDPLTPTLFLDRLERALNGGVRLVQLRAPGLEDAAYQSLAVAVRECCLGHGARLLLNAPPETALAMPGVGLHLSSRRLGVLRERPLGEDRLVGASCHDALELRRAVRLGLDYALLSPVGPTPTHPEAQPLGWERFRQLVEPLPLPVYALGGLGLGDIPQAKHCGGQGIAAIRGLWSD